MKLAKSLLLGSAAGLSVVAGAQAADLAPVRKAAPVEYVRVCTAYVRGSSISPEPTPAFVLAAVPGTSTNFVPSSRRVPATTA